MSNRAQLILILTCVAAALAFVSYRVFDATNGRSYPPGTTFAERARLAESETNGVHVVVVMESDAQGHPLLRATFTPTNRAFHLYSKDHNPKTADGAGLPTRLELLPHSLIKVAGRPFADVESQRHRVMEAIVDIYPDGPVSLRLPIRFIGVPANIAGQVAVTYVACRTDGVCLQPVERQILNVRIQPPEAAPRASPEPHRHTLVLAEAGSN